MEKEKATHIREIKELEHNIAKFQRDCREAAQRVGGGGWVEESGWCLVEESGWCLIQKDIMNVFSPSLLLLPFSLPSFSSFPSPTGGGFVSKT